MKPYIVIEWNDTETEAKGWLCIFNFVKGYLAKTVIAVAFMGALTWIVMSMVNGEFLRLAATVVTGVVSYFALCIMLRNPVCMEYKQTLLRREKQ